MDRETFSRYYSDVRELAVGGTSAVYTAHHNHLGKTVVLKRLKDDYNISLHTREVEILKNLRHRYLPVIYDLINVEGENFIVEDYIQGYDLGAYISSGTYVPEDYILKWLRQMCEVLEYLHTRPSPVYHCDIKPGNIMIDGNFDVCLIDFNISVLQGDPRGIYGRSRDFCSPEQYAKFNEPSLKYSLDARTDIYSTAATFYALMSGMMPSPLLVNPLLIDMGLTYSEGLLRILDKAMSHDRGKRWGSAKQMNDALENLPKYTGHAIFMRRLGLSVLSVGAALMLSGAIIFGVGIRDKKVEEVRSRLDQVVRLYSEEGASYSVFSGAGSLLNDGFSSSVLDDDPQSKAQCYMILAEYEWEKSTEDGYVKASEYYSSAWGLLRYLEDAPETLKVNCILGYSCALAMSGQPTAARTAAENAPGSAAALVSAAIDALTHYDSGDWKSCVVAGQTIPEGNDYPDIRVKLYRILALASEKAADNLESGVRGAVKWLEKAGELDYSSSQSRYLAKYFTNAGTILNDSSLYKKAEFYFDRIKQKNDDDFADWALLESEMGDYVKSETLLSSISSFANDTVKCKMLYVRAFNSVKTGDRASAKSYCSEAVDLYNSMSDRSRSEIDRNALVKMMRVLGLEKVLKDGG